MKKLLTIALTLCLLLTFSGIAEEFTFIQGFDYDYPPYSYRNDDGEVGGFDIEVAQAVCAYLGWTWEPFPLNWDAKDGELNQGNCDCIWSGFTMNGLEDKYTWSIPYSDNTQVILTLADSGINTLDDLAGKIVGVQVATSALALLNDEEGQAELAATFGELLTYETYTLAINDLLAGGIDAIAIDITTCNYNIANSATPEKFAVLEEALGSEQYGIGFRLGETELRDKVNEALIALAKDGTIEEIAKSKEEYAEILEFLSLTAATADAIEASLLAEADTAE